MSEKLVIQSYKGPYTVSFLNSQIGELDQLFKKTPHYIVDRNVASLYNIELKGILDHQNTLIVDANEESKSIQSVIPIIGKMIDNKVRREHILVAIGGGIIQDITCFIASTLLRGVSWNFVPTTLLSQADSCIGSKSSINFNLIKNIIGTFNPPDEIVIVGQFLDTLENKDILSGIGEILKVHAIDGITAFDCLAQDYDRLLYDREVLLGYIKRALLIKKRFIEIDEFDRGIRNIFNYGHSYGHAIESATNFFVPHGIAVSIGMDIANQIASRRGLLPEHHYHRMHEVLKKNYHNFLGIDVPFEAFRAALLKDKKNTATKLVLILPIGHDARIERVEIEADDLFWTQCQYFFDELKA